MATNGTPDEVSLEDRLRAAMVFWQIRHKLDELNSRYKIVAKSLSHRLLSASFFYDYRNSIGHNIAFVEQALHDNSDLGAAKRNIDEAISTAEASAKTRFSRIRLNLKTFFSLDLVLPYQTEYLMFVNSRIPSKLPDWIKHSNWYTNYVGTLTDQVNHLGEELISPSDLTMLLQAVYDESEHKFFQAVKTLSELELCWDSIRHDIGQIRHVANSLSDMSEIAPDSNIVLRKDAIIETVSKLQELDLSGYDENIQRSVDSVCERALVFAELLEDAASEGVGFEGVRALNDLYRKEDKFDQDVIGGVIADLLNSLCKGVALSSDIESVRKYVAVDWKAARHRQHETSPVKRALDKLPLKKPLTR